MSGLESDGGDRFFLEAEAAGSCEPFAGPDRPPERSAVFDATGRGTLPKDLAARMGCPSSPARMISQNADIIPIVAVLDRRSRVGWGTIV